jgi:hypothetical protein
LLYVVFHLGNVVHDPYLFGDIFVVLYGELEFDLYDDRKDYNIVDHGNNFGKYEKINGNEHILFHITAVTYSHSNLISVGTTSILER